MATLPIHPGEILRDALEERGLSANALAGAIKVPANRVTAILKGTRSVSADTALRLARFFGTTPEVWLNLQLMYDLEVAERAAGKSIKRAVKPLAA
jgi:addiction module HigA family antidote